MTADLPGVSGGGESETVSSEDRRKLEERLQHQEQVWAEADSAGIDVWLDLPLSYRSAQQLRRSSGSLRPAIRDLSMKAASHSAVRAIGLGQSLDTTHPETCAILDDWATTVRDVRAARFLYYVTPFGPEADRCTSVVDGILLDVRDRSDVTAYLEEWKTQADVPVGIGAAGTWVDRGAASGLSVPHSREWQARVLETLLTSLIPDLDNPLRAVQTTEEDGETVSTVFVVRWEDGPSTLQRAYGVHTGRGDARPAADVLSGVYLGTQRVFAFPAGTAPGPDAPWAVLLGWLIVGVVAVTYARRPLFRRATTRYFMAHAFYCESIREGRETMPVVNLWMLGAVSIATGVVAAVVMGVLQPRMIAEHVVAALGPVLGGGVETMMLRPVLAGASVTGTVLLLLVLWAAIIGVSVRQSTPLRADQVMMLVIWPCWPALVWMGAALVAASAGATTSTAGLLALLSGTTAVTATIRVLRDVHAVTGAPVGVVLVLALASPAIVLSLGALILWIRYDVPLTLLVRLFQYT